MANVAEAGSGKQNSNDCVCHSPGCGTAKNLLAEATAAAAKKLRDEAAAKRTAAAERAAETERALVREATVEFLRFQFGKKQAPKTPELMEKLQKACKCHLSFGGGFHKDKCSLHPINLKGIHSAFTEQGKHRAAADEKDFALSAAEGVCSATPVWS